MPLDRFTLFGLSVALLGWIILAADTALGFVQVSLGGLTMTAVMRQDVFAVAETAIFSGFALAILGALRAGFGALHRFFDAVLHRASTPKPAPVAYPEPVIEPAVAHPAHGPHAPQHRTVDVKAQRQGRNYTILANGAVEVDTLLGTRVFASLDEARAYIR